MSINLETDVLTVDGAPITSQSQKVVYAFNKPSNVVSSMHDDKGRPCLSDYLTDIDLQVHHVGRLDFESSGLMILTNDGDLTQKLSHPSHEIEKTYLVNVSTSEPDLFVKRVMQGVALEDGLANADACALISSPRRPSHSTKFVECVYLWQIHDGRNRVIRRVAEALNSEVIKLQRVAIGNYFIGRLREGDIKKLTNSDVNQLLERGSFEAVQRLIVQKLKI